MRATHSFAGVAFSVRTTEPSTHNLKGAPQHRPAAASSHTEHDPESTTLSFGIMSSVNGSDAGNHHTSILKAKKSRDLIRESINRVRFELLANRSLHKVLLGVEAADPTARRDYDDYLRMIRDECISEADFMSAIQESRECIALLVKYKELAQALLSLDWLRQPPEAAAQYQLFLIDLLTSHNKYTRFAVRQLIGALVPRDIDQYQYTGAVPTGAEAELRRNRVLETIGRVLEVIPLAHNMVLHAVDSTFPFHTRASYVYAGFLDSVLLLMADATDELKADMFRVVMSK